MDRCHLERGRGLHQSRCGLQKLLTCADKERHLQDLIEMQLQPGFSEKLIKEQIELENQLSDLQMFQFKINRQ